MFCPLILAALCLPARDNEMRVDNHIFGSSALINFSTYTQASERAGTPPLPAFTVKAILSSDMLDMDAGRPLMSEACAGAGQCVRYFRRCAAVAARWQCDYKVSLGPREGSSFSFSVITDTRSAMAMIATSVGVIPSGATLGVPIAQMNAGPSNWK